MNARKYGMVGIPLIFRPYENEGGKRGATKRSPVKAKAVGCGRCGVIGVTLRWNKSKTRKVCPKCYARGNE